ncbi:porin [Alkalimonas sp. MEB108]|uniref:Porin n=1 Tax=Alkalimonas cellulosilytica TaxID=3058395 RepID=A0ABU7J6G3_9GAMM|nr:porin [Alkalimonas sp. MEB108]MEE2002098.1 porin [Alkalimonas sp. MEB108]
MNTIFKMTATTIALAAVSNVAVAKNVDVRGRLHLDTAAYSSDITELGASTAVRRTRLGMNGNLDDLWSFIIEYDFAENGSNAVAVNLQRKLTMGTLTIGQEKVPMGLIELTGSNDITFMERSSNNTITSDAFRLGVHYSLATEQAVVQSMLYTRSIGSSRVANADAPIGVAGRFVWNPIKGDQLVHLGLSVAADDRRGYNTVRYRDRPEIRPADIRLIDTGNLTDVDSTFKYGLEAAYQAGSFSMEAEYLANNVRRSDSTNLTFDGFHIQASYVLTGEKRGYRNGVFRGVRPEGNRGAWEVAARYSVADLSDAEIIGGKQSNITLGLNYYASSSVRFMANLIFSDIKDGINGDEKPKALGMRVQYSF